MKMEFQGLVVEMFVHHSCSSIQLLLYWAFKLPMLELYLNFYHFLQFGRYSALLLGIMWGSHRYSVNKKAEDAWRAEEAERKVIRDAKKAEEKAVLNRQELLYLAEQAGVKVPPNFWMTQMKPFDVH